MKINCDYPFQTLAIQRMRVHQLENILIHNINQHNDNLLEQN